jgi:hypothetical protein
VRRHLARRRLAPLLAPLLAAGALRAQPPGASPTAVTVPPGAPCPPGTAEVRPQRCQAPELPAPSILDYRPRSTLVTAAHPVPRAKYPAVDFHGHPSGLLDSPEGLARLGAAMDALNLRVMVAANNLSGDALARAAAAVRASPAMRDRVRVLAGVDFRDVGPGWAERAVAQLERDAAAGAVGVGEISKALGLSLRKADGTRLRLDDPALDPVWRRARGSGCPCSSTRPTRRSSGSPSTRATSAGSSSRSSRGAATRRGSTRRSRRSWPSATPCCAATRARRS